MISEKLISLLCRRHRDAMDIPYTNNEAYVLSNFAETIAYE